MSPYFSPNAANSCVGLRKSQKSASVSVRATYVMWQYVPFCWHLACRVKQIFSVTLSLSLESNRAKRGPQTNTCVLPDNFISVVPLFHHRRFDSLFRPTYHHECIVVVLDRNGLKSNIKKGHANHCGCLEVWCLLPVEVGKYGLPYAGT